MLIDENGFDGADLEMSTNAHATQALGKDRRSERRHKVSKRALLYFHDQPSGVDIILRDLSAHGCRLQLRYAIPLPRTFLVAFPEIELKRPARLVWQKDDMAGVQFLDEMPLVFRQLLPE